MAWLASSTLPLYPTSEPFSCCACEGGHISPRAAAAASGKTRQPLWMVGSQAKLFRVVMLGRVRRSALQTRSDMKEERRGVQGRGARRTGVHVEGEKR